MGGDEDGEQGHHNSKDVTIDPSTGVSARLYLPANTSKKKLPVLIYIHGGGFIIETAFSPTYHNYLNSLVSQAHILTVSVDYRRALEHPLPAAYDDSWAAAKWVSSLSNAWLAERGDLNHVFLAGDSAGANIAHNVAMRTGKTELGPGVRIEGLVLVHPFFWGSKPVGTESTDPVPRGRTEELWKFTCPGTVGVDDPWINPLAEGAPGLEGLACARVLVTVAEEDFLRERGRAYYEGLKASGWRGEAELLESERRCAGWCGAGTVSPPVAPARRQLTPMDGDEDGEQGHQHHDSLRGKNIFSKKIDIKMIT